LASIPDATGRLGELLEPETVPIPPYFASICPAGIPLMVELVLLLLHIGNNDSCPFSLASVAKTSKMEPKHFFGK
jgi:hypothetical protein